MSRPTTPEQLRVAIIGAGPSGLSLLHAFEAARRAGEPVPDLVCFEKQATWGGLWNYTWRTGIDDVGEPVHGSMYRDLWSNGPKESIEFPDYPFDQHFGRAVPSYLPREAILGYLAARARRDHLDRHIQFDTVVTDVQAAADGQGFTVSRRRLHPDQAQTDQARADQFDYVVVATGHYSVPNAPTWPGFDAFPGRILHSHDLRDVSEFAGQRVLIVGAGDSAEDVALQSHKYGACSVVISHRSGPLGHIWPPSVTEVPLLLRMDGGTAHFVDGQSADVDVIVLCTGYRHSFPFMAPPLRLGTRNRLYPDDLYKGIFFQHDPRVIYLGMQYQYYTFTMFEAQAWYARDVILGRRALASEDERAIEMQSWLTQERAATTGDEELDFQTSYVADLLVATDYPPVDLAALAAMFRQVETDKARSILHFRDSAMVSLFTGTRAADPARPWMEAMGEPDLDLLC